MSAQSHNLATYPSLKDKRVFITGGGTGIGENLVESFCLQGACVTFVDIAHDKSEALVERLSQTSAYAPVYEHCDIRDTQALAEVIRQAGERSGDISILINNAADDARHEFEDVTAEYWDANMAINLRPAFFASQAVVSQMRRVGGGAIINMGSASWHLKQPFMPAYTTAKAAIEGLTRSLAGRLGQERIRVNTLMPGWVMTEKQQRRWLNPDIVEDVKQSQCIHENLMPQDVANAALFLAADDSRMMTAQTLVIDAGWI